MPIEFISIAAPVKENDVRAELGFLASDAMRGRKSGSNDELLAGEYIASELQKAGALPAGDFDANGNRTYMQAVDVGTRQTFTSAPTITAEGGRTLNLREDFIVRTVAGSEFSGPLQRLDAGEAPQSDAVIYVDLPADISRKDFKDKIMDLSARGAKNLIVSSPSFMAGMWDHLAEDPIVIMKKHEDFKGGIGYPDDLNFVLADADAAHDFATMSEGTPVRFSGQVTAPEPVKTWNAVAYMPGTDPDANALLLTAHMDHLGVAEGEGDVIYNGADDDASGCVAVIELAKQLGKDGPSRRPVYFVTYGSEELGGFGSTYFMKHPPLPLDKIAANLEFEMIGHKHPKLADNHVLMTGFDYSNLGPELVRQGGLVTQDPHPEQDFFRRSDNYVLAKKGVVAHTLCSYDPHTNPDYHQVTDDVDHIDFGHMTAVINSLVAPVKGLANSDFVPAWNDGQDPSKQ